MRLVNLISRQGIDIPTLLTTRQLAGGTSTPGDHLAAKSIISFITILWHANTQSCIFQRAGPFLRAILAFIRKQASQSQVSLMYCDTLLIALSVLGSGHASKGCVSSIQEEYIWTLAMRLGHSNLTIACERYYPCIYKINH